MCDLDGTYLGAFGEVGEGPGEIRSPYTVDVDVDGYVYVCDTQNVTVQKFTADGGYLGSIGAVGSDSGEITFPINVVAGDDVNVYVVDAWLNRVTRFDPVP